MADLKSSFDAECFDTIRLHPSPDRFKTAGDAPEIAPGRSRVGGPILDLPPAYALPRDLHFVAQLDLAWLSPFDRYGILPDHGFLYFFYAYRDHSEFGGLHYYPGRADQLLRTVRESRDWFSTGTILAGCSAESDRLADRFDEDGNWQFFAPAQKSKVFGFPGNVQWGEDETRAALDGGRKLLLLQVGYDINGEGSLCFYVDAAKCARGEFDECEAMWSQS